MNPLTGKKIILGVTGCIAAYKSCLLVRELVKNGADVRVVLTPSASEFVSPLTLSTLSRNKVIQGIFPAQKGPVVEADPWHIEYGLWADLMVIAPASINTVAKMAMGFADNALTTLVTARRSPLLVCPAADVDMYEYPLTQRNLKLLEDQGAYILEAESGELASGLTGKGRLPETGKIVEAIKLILYTGSTQKDLAGRKVLVTAGPTYEDIDPVRYLGNRSSGKMGFEIAKAAWLRGADVTLVAGPSSLALYPEITRMNVRTADQMKKAVEENLTEDTILIMAAAVADFTPSAPGEKKIKKAETAPVIELRFTDDILFSLKERPKKLAVGFALETDNEEQNAVDKMNRKNLDMIILNSLNDTGSGFEYDTNLVTMIERSGEKVKTGLLTKTEIAHKILDKIVTKI
ncbi:MAG: bifunctional phosphopantothenoylcysteine decarboxylase/phosphopantothenate--cysteine ligase CoaBC [Ignavibacteriaceae bacterium]|nr:bifunctional phosphopantothenoylcysteine decarboxylase/phosphopantothenate--cysteine ligase CoaBC [Ignavibacteriaceae bacterium]